MREQSEGRMMTLIGSVMVLVVMLGAGRASADTIDFVIAPPTPGSISFAGGTAPLIGSNIEVDSLVGLDTPANASVPIDCIGCILSFETGGLTGFSSSLSSGVDQWTFGSGGEISIFGALDLDGDGNVDLDSRTLLSGTFGLAEVIKVSDGVLRFTVAVGSFSDTKDSDVLAFFGLPNAEFLGGMNISFDLQASAFGGDPFASSQVLSGNIANTLVPLPGTLPLLGGALGLFAMLKRRRIRLQMAAA